MTLQLPELCDHPAMTLFRNSGVSIYRVAKYLGLQHNRTWLLLSGRATPSREQEQKINALTKIIEKDGKMLK